MVDTGNVERQGRSVKRRQAIASLPAPRAGQRRPGGLLDRDPARSGEILRGFLVGRLIVTPRTIAGERWFDFLDEASYAALPEASTM